MGLDCSHDAFHGAYSAFNRFRQIVAKAAGGSYPDHDDPALDPRRWYVPDGWKNKDHPGFTEFMNHSDCDGEISPDMCLLVADELEALLPSIAVLCSKHTYGENAGFAGDAGSLKGDLR